MTSLASQERTVEILVGSYACLFHPHFCTLTTRQLISKQQGQYWMPHSAVKTDISDGTIALPALFRSLEETLSGLLALSGLRLKSAFLRISVVTSNKRQRSGVLFSQLTQCFIQTYYFASSFLSLAIISFSRANVTNQNTNKPLRALPSDWRITARADTPFVVSQWINALSLKKEIILNRRIIKALRVFTANKW